MAVTPSQLSFNAGELGPFVDARFDIEKYRFGCKTLENWWPKVEGPLDFRPGTHHAGLAKYAHNKVRVESFVFSETTRFVLEIGLNYIRFWSNYLSVDNGASIDAWAQPADYIAGDYVTNGGSNYFCLQDHSAAATFPTDEDEIMLGTITANGVDVTGIGTDFAVLAAGDWIRTDTGGYYAKVASVTDVTHLTLETPFQGLEGDRLISSSDWRRTKWLEQDTLEVHTPYSVEDVFLLDIEQINDVLYIAHPDHPLAKLTRLADDNWTYAPVDWDFPPLITENITDTTITPLALTGDTTLNASAAIFKESHVGSYWAISHRFKGHSVKLKLIGSLSPTGSAPSASYYRLIKGDWSISTVERWAGKLEIVRCDKDDDVTVVSNWEVIREFESEANSNIAASGNQPELAYIGLRYNETGANPYGASYWRNAPATTPEEPLPYAYYTSDEAYLGGFVKVTGFTSSTEVGVTVKQKLTSLAATKLWSEGAFSDVRGHPRTVKLFDGRLTLNGHVDEPKGSFQSVVDDFENFEYGALDSDALRFIIAGRRNVIQWVEEAQGKLFMGTLGEEMAISGGGYDQPITPTSVKAKTGTSYGSERLPAVNLNDVIVFVQQGGKFVRELVYNWDAAGEGGYQSNDLTRLARHITGDGITDIGVSKAPFPIYWATREDGELIGLLLERTDAVASWFRTTPGQPYGTGRYAQSFNSVCTIPDNSGNDEVWVSVTRFIGGPVADSARKQIQTIEYFDDGAFTPGDVQSAWRLDRARRVTNPVLSENKWQIQRDMITWDGYDTGNPDLKAGFRQPRYRAFSGSEVHGLATGNMIRVGDCKSFPELAGELFRIVKIDANSFYLVHPDPNTDRSIGNITQESEAEISVAPYYKEFPLVSFIDGVLGMTEINGQSVLMKPEQALELASSAKLDQLNTSGYSAYGSGGTIYRSPAVSAPEDAFDSTAGAQTGDIFVVDTLITDPPNGIDWLEGETFSAMIDGKLYEDVTTTGTPPYIALPVPGNDILYGFQYEGRIETQKIDLPMDVGASRGRIASITRIILSLYESWGLKVGIDPDNLEEATYNEPDETTDTDLQGKTKECPVYVSGVKRSPTVTVLQDKPYPATLLALHPKMEVSQDS